MASSVFTRFFVSHFGPNAFAPAKQQMTRVKAPAASIFGSLKPSYAFKAQTGRRQMGIFDTVVQPLSSTRTKKRGSTLKAVSRGVGEFGLGLFGLSLPKKITNTPKAPSAKATVSRSGTAARTASVDMVRDVEEAFSQVSSSRSNSEASSRKSDSSNGKTKRASALPAIYEEAYSFDEWDTAARVSAVDEVFDPASKPVAPVGLMELVSRSMVVSLLPPRTLYANAAGQSMDSLSHYSPLNRSMTSFHSAIAGDASKRWLGASSNNSEETLARRPTSFASDANRDSQEDPFSLDLVAKIQSTSSRSSLTLIEDLSAFTLPELKFNGASLLDDVFPAANKVTTKMLATQGYLFSNRAFSNYI